MFTSLTHAYHQSQATFDDVSTVFPTQVDGDDDGDDCGDGDGGRQEGSEGMRILPLALFLSRTGSGQGLQVEVKERCH